VVAVTDLAIQLDELVPAGRDLDGGQPHPRDRPVHVENHGHTPQRSAAVITGASQSSSSSSSSRATVTDAPRISREVT